MFSANRQRVVAGVVAAVRLGNGSAAWSMAVTVTGRMAVCWTMLRCPSTKHSCKETVGTLYFISCICLYALSMATTAQPRTSAAPPCDVMVRASCAFLVITTLRQSPIGPGPSCLTLWGAPAAGRDVACRTHGLSRSIDGAGFRPRGGAERCRSHEGDLGDAEQALGGTHGIHASRLLTMPVADKRPSVIDCSPTRAVGQWQPAATTLACGASRSGNPTAGGQALHRTPPPPDLIS